MSCLEASQSSSLYFVDFVGVDFVLKKSAVAKSSAELLPVSLITASPSTPCSVRHSFCELPLFAEIVVSQKLPRLAS